MSGGGANTYRLVVSTIRHELAPPSRAFSPWRRQGGGMVDKHDFREHRVTPVDARLLPH